MTFSRLSNTGITSISKGFGSVPQFDTVLKKNIEKLSLFYYNSSFFDSQNWDLVDMHRAMRYSHFSIRAG